MPTIGDFFFKKKFYLISFSMYLNGFTFWTDSSSSLIFILHYLVFTSSSYFKGELLLMFFFLVYFYSFLHKIYTLALFHENPWYWLECRRINVGKTSYTPDYFSGCSACQDRIVLAISGFLGLDSWSSTSTQVVKSKLEIVSLHKQIEMLALKFGR